MTDLRARLPWKVAKPESSPPEDALTRPTGYQQTASRLHSFNRYEINYLLDEFRVSELRAALVARMGSDPFSPRGGYPVTWLYYDTEELRFYWEKLEGLRFSRKLRMRLYGNPTECTDERPSRSRSSSGSIALSGH